MINVTKTYLPDINKYKSYVDKIYESNQLTNRGPLVRELEERLQEYLGVKNLILVANGTIALQVAYKALDIKGKVITTPFSFVATTSSLVWEGLEPLFADIDPKTLNIDPIKIEETIEEDVSAILPVHVFGNPCVVEAIEKIAQKKDLKLIYDGAHAFAVKYKDQSVFNWGDITTVSFHATKLFHTIEGGAIITADDTIAERVRRLINFGIERPEQISHIGINGKMNEFEAAMGLCVLDDIDYVLEEREKAWNYYYDNLQGLVDLQKRSEFSSNNYSYFPILLESEEKLLEVQRRLNEENIFPRRYFYPSLDTLSYTSYSSNMFNSRDIVSRILCLPIYCGINLESQNTIANSIINVLHK
ncbi:DegT/DnrJ/EryC1/StrS family aminotransferase [Heliorestis acidaminivorans]|uniref:DegT/DnrJ/EryC1/StrS family aminotransferase n=1 Tax=Heliorestis acidaminivorans TaxID=553427 RepID=A0A6I0F2I6_9FIRM|nr:DegT/DnrJ/EryC1/StrS family aminotransferase [Heliorestis acidaminivorans]KAB2953770.1 DegT/DnrJ/EryC1/StrS family aminotransferase [Heliorestis acidaminivorans]